MRTSFFKRSELAEVLASFRREFLWVGFFSMIANVLMLTPTLYMLQVFDRVLASQSELTLIFLSLIVFVFFCTMAFADWIRSRILVRAGVKLDQKLNPRVFNASFESYLKLIHKNPTQAFADLTNLRQFLTGNGIIAFFDIPWTPIYILVIFLLHPFLGGLSILFVVIQLAITFFGEYRGKGINESLTLAESKSRAYLHSKLKNAEPVEAMGMLHNLRASWIGLHTNQLAQMSEVIKRQKSQQAFAKFIRYSMQSLTLGAAALLVIDGELSVGAMIAANILMTRALQPLDLISGSWKGFLQAKVAFLDLEMLLKIYPDRDGAIQYPTPTGLVSLKKLTATAANRINPILEELNLDFRPGQVTVVIGPSGSGKSTLARCLVGIWPDFSGQVLIDETPIELWDREQLGPCVGYLPQDVELFEGTIAENISRFNEVDSEKVIEAAQHAGIHDMILHFPMGYDTPIGEAGMSLSGGQRQRLGLARAMYGNPSIIVLDEPNSNLDEYGERALVQAIKTLKAQKKSIILITHRLNILGAADYLLALENGKVAHYGTRDEVIETINKQAKSNKNATPVNDSGLKPA